MNLQNDKKISWCDVTINPVVGCTRMCGAEYDENGNITKDPWCYAYKMNRRFGYVKDFTKPQFFPDRLKALYSKKPKAIFMNSMSDIQYWSIEAEIKTIKAIKENPQHNYIFLTKSNEKFIYNDANIFYGCTITKQIDFNYRAEHFIWFSIEPILEEITIPHCMFKNLRQIIIGAETGNRKGKVIPKKEWIDSLVKQADEHGIRVFMKESLRALMGDDFRMDELIWSARK